MKRISKRFKAGLSLVLVLGMVLGNVVSARAVAPSYPSGVNTENMKENGYNNTAYEYNDKEPAERQSDVDAIEILAKDAKEAAEAAKTAAETASDKAADAVSQAAIANGEVETIETSAQTAETEAGYATEDANAVSAAAVEFVSDVNDYNDAVDADNEVVSGAAATVTDVCGTIADDTEEAAEKTAELKETALKALEDALGAKEDDSLTDEEKNAKIISAAAIAAEAAAEAEKVVSEAAVNVKSAEDAKDAAIAEYNKYAMTYGLYLYGEDEFTYTAEDLKKAGIKSMADTKDQLDDDYKGIQNVSIDDHKRNVENAVKAFNEAVEKYDDAKDAAEDAAEAAETAAKTAAEKCDDAELAASNLYNYYITPAQNKLDSTNNKIADASNRLSVANGELSTTKTNFENKEAAMVAQAKLDFASKKAAREKERDDAINNAYREYQNAVDDYNNAFWGKTYLWAVVGAKWTAYETVKAAQNLSYSIWENDNTESKAVNAAKEAAAKTTEKALYDQATVKVNSINGEISTLNGEKAKYETELTNAQNKAASEIADIKAGLDEANKKLIEDIAAMIQSDNNKINQEQFNQALNEWANDVNWETAIKFWSQDHSDAHAIRKEMGKEYDQALWKKILNTPGILQGTISTTELNKKMTNRIEAYRKELQALYEKKANMEAEVAKLNAQAAETSANTSAANASAAAVSIKAIADDLVTVVEDAQQAVSDAAIVVADAKKAAKDIYSLNNVDLKKLLNAIADAESQLEAAKKSLEVATEAKDKAVKYAEYADNYDEYAKADGELQQFTAFVETEIELVRAPELAGTIKGFVAVSDKTLDVPEEIYRKYLKAVVAHERDKKAGIEDKTGEGVVIGTEDETPILYWEVENDLLTGRFFESTTDLETGKYFIGKSFVKNTNDYDMVGVMVDYVKPVSGNPTSNDPVNTDPTNTDSTNNDPVNNNPVDNTPSNNTPSNNTPSNTDSDDNTVVLTDGETPQGSATDEGEVDDSKVNLKDDTTTPSDDELEEMDLTDDLQSLGDAGLAKTGTVPVVVFYFAAVALLLAAIYFKKSFAKEN